MRVEVKLFVNLRAYEGHLIDGGMELPERETIRGLMSEIGIDPVLVMLVSVNGQTSNWDTVLEDGDVVTFFPMVAGG